MKSGKTSFLEFLDIIKTLRGPHGCPWDKTQTSLSLSGHLIEEVYELLEAVTSNDKHHIREELGDVLLLIGLLCSIYSEKGDFSIEDVIDSLNEKLVRRHSHVFGDIKVKNSDEAIQNWERIKKTEDQGVRRQSAMDGLPKDSPPLERAYGLQVKAHKVGFDWPNADGSRQKIYEEFEEVGAETDEEKRLKEMGDLLFSVINYSRHLGINPSVALLHSNAEFERRFRGLEKKMQKSGLPLAPENIDIMNDYWEAEKTEK